jgi:hypothetical protein
MSVKYLRLNIERWSEMEPKETRGTLQVRNQGKNQEQQPQDEYKPPEMYTILLTKDQRRDWRKRRQNSSLIDEGRCTWLEWNRRGVRDLSFSEERLETRQLLCASEAFWDSG